MSKSVDNHPKEQHHGHQHLKDTVVSDACPIQHALPSLELKSKDGKTQAAPRTLTLRKRSSDFALTSYNSAFLEGLFEDIAVKSSNVVPGEEQREGKYESLKPTSESPDPTAEDVATLSVAVPSDSNLSKRRRVSTNKSLGRFGQSLANLASCADLSSFRKGVAKKASVLISSSKASPIQKNKMELPATVSASYSFHLDLSSQEQPSPEETKDQMSQQGDFGWFIDTDDQEDFGFLPGLSIAKGTSAIPLAFSAPTAPRSPSHDHQAEVEWARAADTVDEVLGDLF